MMPLRLPVSGWVSFLLLLVCHTAGWATASPVDTLDVRILEEITVFAPRWEQPDHKMPVHIQRIPESRRNRFESESAAWLLKSHSFVMLREYGQGNMAQASQRGMSASQTRIYWEGIPLNHPMHGGLDMSRIPAGFISDVTVSSGNPAALTGSGAGAVGGIVSMNSGLKNEKATIRQTIGKYGYRQTEGGMHLNQGRVHAGVRVMVHEGDFDFPYDDSIRQRERKREHNAMRGSMLMAQAGYASDKHSIRSVFWADHSENNLPGSISAIQPARQDDRALRWLLQSSIYPSDRLSITSTWALYRYDLDYKSYQDDRWDRSSTGLYMFQPSLRYTWDGRHESFLVLHMARQEARSDNYTDRIEGQMVSVRWNHTWETTRFLHVYPSLEWDHHTAFGSYIHPALSATVTPATEILTLRAAINQTRNIPTYNDLYWAPGGNPDLVPEEGISMEAGFIVRYTKASTASLHMEMAATLFHHDFKNGIRWRPGTNGRFSPVNLEEIRSKGVELSIQAEASADGWKLLVSWLTAITDASIQKERFPGDNSVGKQLFYVPKWTHKGLMEVSFHQHAWMQLSAGYTGERYTTFDHSGIRDPMKATFLLDLDIGSKRVIGDVTAEARIGVRNLTNRAYETMLWYPAAPRHMMASISFTWK